MPNFDGLMCIKQLPGPVLRIRIVCAQKLIGREGNPECVDGISHVTHFGITKGNRIVPGHGN